MERKRIIPVEKRLNGELVEPSFFQEPENAGASQPTERKMQQWNNARVTGDRESME
jgi:hypothetical protein